MAVARRSAASASRSNRCAAASPLAALLPARRPSPACTPGTPLQGEREWDPFLLKLEAPEGLEVGKVLAITAKPEGKSAATFKPRLLTGAAPAVPAGGLGAVVGVAGACVLMPAAT